MPAERHLGGFLIVDHEADAAGRPGAMRPVGHGRSAVTRGRIGAPWVLVDAARACRCAGAWFRRPSARGAGRGPRRRGRPSRAPWAAPVARAARGTPAVAGYRTSGGSGSSVQKFSDVRLRTFPASETT